MDIIRRNFISLIRNGAFGENDTLEPMSKYKWGLLHKLAEIHGVDSIIDYTLNQGKGALPKLPLPDAGLSRLYNRRLNKRLQNIREQEPSSDDSSIETLNMLDILIQTAEAMLSYGLSIGNIVRTGIYLQNDGDKIDYIKLDNWLKRLDMHRMAQLIGSLLVELLDFEPEAIPFLSRMEPSAKNLAHEALYKPHHIKAEEWKVRQLNNGFIGNNNKAMLQVAYNCCKFFVYAPIETISSFIARFTDSLANIEE